MRNLILSLFVVFAFIGCTETPDTCEEKLDTLNECISSLTALPTGVNAEEAGSILINIMDVVNQCLAVADMPTDEEGNYIPLECNGGGVE